MLTRRNTALLIFAAVVVAASAGAHDTNPDRLLSPEKGISVGKAYQLGDIESVNLSNGGLTLRIQLARLPAGPAGSAGVTLVYNSKYWEDAPSVFSNGVVTHQLQASPGGGWRLKFDYELVGVFPETREANDVCAPGSGSYLVQLILTGPDGSEHKMYSVNAPQMPNGCEAGTYRNVDVNNTSVQVWYSLDGSFLRLVMQPGSDNWLNNNWTLYEPDGHRVECVNGAGGRVVTRYDKNGNSFTWSTSTFTDNDGGTRAKDILSDEFGHSITILHHVLQDEVQQAGNGEDLSTLVNYTQLSFTGLQYQNNTGSGGSTQAPFDTTALPDAVNNVQLPSRITPAGTNYEPTFTFLHGARYRELSQMTLPSGAVTNYTWGLDDNSCVSPGVPTFFTVQINRLDV